MTQEQKERTGETKMTQEQKERTSETKVTKSQMFREMWDNQGLSVSEIAKETESNYAFVYGVIRAHVGKDGIKERSGRSGETKADQMRQLYDEGHSIGDIAKITESNYSYAWRILDTYRKSLEGEE